MRLALILSLAALPFASLSYAADKNCACDQKCMTQCEKGNPKGCKCKHCNCAKTHKCNHEQCKTEHHEGHHDEAQQPSK
jgi:hypothetical protein